MQNWRKNFYQQLTESTVVLEPTFIPLENSQAYQGIQSATRNSVYISSIKIPETLIIVTSMSSMGNSWVSGHSHGYVQLGEALREMVELEEDDEWRIDELVYTAACHIAVLLKDATYPAPRIFNHGRKSVVFNWLSGNNNLYLTIGSNTFSAMLSSPERIEQRIDSALDQIPNPTLLLSILQPDPQRQPFVSVKAASEPTEPYE